jgi:hypothetical protein
LAGVIQQQGDLGSIGHVMASKIVGQPHRLPSLFAWQAMRLPYKSFS